MTRQRPTFSSLSLALLLVTACSSLPDRATFSSAPSGTGVISNGNTEALGPDAIPLLGPAVIMPASSYDSDDAAPASMLTTLDEARTERVTVSAAGGTVSATAEDGTRFTLTIPGAALLTGVEITMTPTASVAAATGDGAQPLQSARGVHLEPDGLRLYDLGSLRIEPPEAPDPQTLAVAAAGGGIDVHPYPATVEAGAVTMPVVHFSLLIIISDGDDRRFMQDILPAGDEAQFEKALAEAKGDGRTDQVERLLDALWDRVARPLFERGATDCAYFQANIHRIHGIQILGIIYTTGGDAIYERLTAWSADTKRLGRPAMLNCWREATEGCIDPANREQMARITALKRQSILLGIAAEDDPEFDLRAALAKAGGPPCGDVFGTVAWSLEETFEDPDFGLVKRYSETVVMNINMQGGADLGSSFSYYGQEVTHANHSYYPCSDANQDFYEGRVTSRSVSSWANSGRFEGADDGRFLSVSIDRPSGEASISVGVTAVNTGSSMRTECGHTSREVFVPQDWYQEPFCPEIGDLLTGTVSGDGRTADFACTGSEDVVLNDNDPNSRRVRTSGRLTIR